VLTSFSVCLFLFYLINPVVWFSCAHYTDGYNIFDIEIVILTFYSQLLLFAISCNSLVKWSFFKREIFMVCSCCECKCESENVMMDKFCFRMLQHHFNINVSFLVCSCVFSTILGRGNIKEGKRFRMTLLTDELHTY
jgi:hypothetical protein